MDHLYTSILDRFSYPGTVQEDSANDSALASAKSIECDFYIGGCIASLHFLDATTACSPASKRFIAALHR